MTFFLDLTAPERRVRTNGAYVIRSAESRPVTVVPRERTGPAPMPTERDVALARAIQRRACDRRTVDV